MSTSNPLCRNCGTSLVKSWCPKCHGTPTKPCQIQGCKKTTPFTLCRFHFRDYCGKCLQHRNEFGFCFSCDPHCNCFAPGCENYAVGGPRTCREHRHLPLCRKCKQYIRVDGWCPNSDCDGPLYDCEKDGCAKQTPEQYPLCRQHYREKREDEEDARRKLVQVPCSTVYTQGGQEHKCSGKVMIPQYRKGENRRWLCRDCRDAQDTYTC